MSKYSLTHLSARALFDGLRASVGRERDGLALVLAYIAEIEAQKLYVPAAHPSMKSYLVHELHISEQAALKRLRAARTARNHPAIFTAVAEGRLNLSAIVLLSAHLTPENVHQLVDAAANMNNAEIERMLRGTDAEPDGQLSLIAPPQTVANAEAQVSVRTPVATRTGPDEDAVAPVATQPTPFVVAAEERYELRCQMSREAHEQMLYARELLSHAVPNGDLGKIVARAMKALVRELEKQKFGATDRPGKQRGSSDPGYIPLAVKREVLKRDGGQCAFQSDDGKRCPSHELLEFHHKTEVALGGTASVSNISLRCRTHNQYESERTFGKAFMENKRDQAKAAAAKRRAAREAIPVVSPEEEQQTIWWLGIFGYSEEDARWALEEVGPRRFALPGTRGIRCMEVLKARAGDTSPLFA